MDVSGPGRLDRPNQNVVSFQNRHQLPGALEMFARSWLEPANRRVIASMARQMIKRRGQMIVEPILKFGERVEFVVRQTVGPTKPRRTTEQARGQPLARSDCV